MKLLNNIGTLPWWRACLHESLSTLCKKRQSQRNLSMSIHCRESSQCVVYDLKGSFPSRRVYDDVKHMIAIVSFSLSSSYFVMFWTKHLCIIVSCVESDSSFTASLSDSNSEYGKNKPKLLLYIMKLCNFHNHQSSSFLAKI